ncbi:MAG: hypothetical protein D4R73_09110 [Deltaproteobacteria bacterium]|nr:MAG: hypothetical protein D4R73_09110 [Deltaproteobacteria bacterium]
MDKLISPATIPRVLHLYWGKDKPLSWLRWLTAYTFARLNPDWRVIVWYPKNSGAQATWRTGEHAHYAWQGEDWFKRLSEAGPNVEVREAPIDDFPAGMTEVHRSDLLRWRLLHTMGGFWSDFDILYFRPMSALTVNLTADALLCWGETQELKHWQAIGFLGGTPGCNLYREMERVGLEMVNKPMTDYQGLGTHLLVKFAPPGVKEAGNSIVGQIPQHAVYPFRSVRHQMLAIWLDRQRLDVRAHTIGIHWFAGNRLSSLPEASWQSFADVQKDSRSSGLKWAMAEAGFIGPYKEGKGVEYSIIMPYIDRPILLHNTLLSYQYWYKGRQDWELLIIQDSKCARPEELHQVVAEWQTQGLPIRVIVQEADDCYGPSKLFNRGVIEAKGVYVVLTSPEIYHESNILAALDKAFDGDPEQYLVCACQSRKAPAGNAIKIGQHGELSGVPEQWFQHSKLRPARYHFCSALNKQIYLQSGGFDESFSEGFCFDDDDFRESLLKAGVVISQRDALLVSHQWHDHCIVPNEKVRWKRNKALYEAKHGPYKFIPAPEVRLVRKTPLLPPPEIQMDTRPAPARATTIACVLKTGGDFDERYVANLKRALDRNLTHPFKFVCLTDDPKIKGVEIIRLTNGHPGWWSKIELFRPGAMSTERVLYFDLDTLILKNIDDLLTLGGDFYGLRPWNRANRLAGNCASGIMAWKNGSHDFLYEKFNATEINHLGDQVYISAALKAHGGTFMALQDAAPGIYSYKRECRQGVPPRDARIVCFHGRPRVHEVGDRWVKEAWR